MASEPPSGGRSSLGTGPSEQRHLLANKNINHDDISLTQSHGKLTYINDFAGFIMA